MTIRDYVGEKASDLFTSEVKSTRPSGTRGSSMEVVGVDEWKPVTVDKSVQSGGNGISSADMTIPKFFNANGTAGVNEGEGFYNG